MILQTILFFVFLIILTAGVIYLSFPKQTTKILAVKILAVARHCIFPSGSKEVEQAKCQVKHYVRILSQTGNIGEPSLKFERDFRIYMDYWPVEAIDTTRAALLSLTLLKNNESFIEKHKDSILNFVESCFDKEQGGYKIVPELKEPTIYATYNAIDVIIMLNKRDIIDGGKKSLIKSFLKKHCRETEDNIYTMCDAVENGTDGIFPVYLTWRLLQSLNEEKFFNDELISKDFSQYIRNCYKTDIGGFVLNSSQKEPGMATTYFALSLIDKAFDSKSREKFFDEEKIKTLKTFLNDCWDDGQMGGYSTARGTLSSLRGTYFALRTMELLPPKDEEKTNKIARFVKGCYCKGGGFAFLDSEAFLPKEPSAHATRWALQIEKYLGKNILGEEQREETKNFIKEKLYNPQKGGFSGFPILYYEAGKIIEIRKCPLLKHIEELSPIVA